MSTLRKPMLATGGLPFEKVEYPMLSSLKVDGIRCLIIRGELYTRSMKAQPTRDLRRAFAELIAFSMRHEVVIDGEIYDHSKPFCWHQSTFRSFEGKVSRGTRLWIIDVVPLDVWEGAREWTPFYHPHNQELREQAGQLPYAKLIPQTMVQNPEEAQAQYDLAIEGLYEGTMLRSPYRGYKHGRCTTGENWLLKYKAWQDYDAQIIEVQAGVKVKSDAEVRVSPTGDSERSHKGEDYEASGMAGAIRVRLEDGTECGIGTWAGWTHELRVDMLANPERYVGRWIRFKGQAAGVKDAPRIPHAVMWKDGTAIVPSEFELRDEK